MTGGMCCLSDQLLNRCFNFPWAVRRKILTDGKDDVRCRQNKIPVLPVKLLDNSFKPVSFDCAFNPVNADAQPVFPGAVGLEDQAEVFAPQAFPRPINPVIIFCSGEQA